MGSRKRAPHTAPGTAARIRDAAICEFAAHGISRTTVRAIATAAGVSPGLVIHHFGSKEGLRNACDDYVFEALTEAKRENAEHSPLVVAELLSNGPHRANAEYLLMSLLDPSTHGQRFFDHYVESIEQILDEGFAGYTFRKSDDLRAQATAIAMLALAPLLLEPRARRALGTEDLAGSMARITPELFELYVHGYVAALPDGQPPARPQATPGSQHDPPDPASPENCTPSTKDNP